MAKKTVDQKIDDLAHAVKRGFDGADKRFDEVDKRFDRLEYLVTGHDRRVEILEDRMRQVAVKVGLKFN